MRISVNPHQTVSFVKSDTRRYLKLFKFKLRYCNAEVKEHLFSSYGKSLLRYLGTPLLGAKLIKECDIKRMEA
jgi:hypothetical protein